VAAYTVVHDRDGAPRHGVLIVDLQGGDRAYAWVTRADLIADAERRELIGQRVRLAPDGQRNIAEW
jgi:acetyl-CoA C-acetyltransferase